MIAANRRTPVLADVGEMMQRKNIQLSTLVDYISQVSAVGCPLVPPVYPVRRVETTVAVPGPKESAYRAAVCPHVPAYLPPMFPYMDETVEPTTANHNALTPVPIHNECDTAVSPLQDTAVASSVKRQPSERPMRTMFVLLFNFFFGLINMSCAVVRNGNWTNCPTLPAWTHDSWDCTEKCIDKYYWFTVSSRFYHGISSHACFFFCSVHSIK
jgi:hypothetical protein